MMKKITLLVLLVLSFQNFSAQTINIPDQNLKDALLNYDPAIDTNVDGEIQVSEALAVTELEFSSGSSFDPKIQNTTGLEAFQNLTSLTIWNHSITAIDLTSFVNLEELNLDHNQISAIDFSNNLALQQIDVGFNNLYSIDVSMLLDLKDFYVRNNNLVLLDLSNNLALEKVDCQGNPLTSLDVSNNSNLEYLELMYLENLQYLNLKNVDVANLYAEAPFSDMESLEYVCVDDVDVFFESFYNNEWLGEPWFTVSTNCDFNMEAINLISGVVKYDTGLGCNDPSAVVIPNTIVTTTINGEDYGTITNANGSYILYTSEGTNTLTVGSIDTNYAFTPASQQVNFTGYGNQETVNFCAEANAEVNDVSIVFLPLQTAVPGFSINYQIVFTNNGTTSLDGEILLTYDENLQTFIVASPSETATTTNTISFSFTDLAPFQSDYINVEFLNAQPPTLNSGDSLDFNIEITTSVIDDNPSDNEFTYSQEVVNSFDPNDKSVLEGSEVYIEEAINYLHYMVRFQNTGTANAQKVVVKDTLSDNLDWSSLQMVSASDDYQVNIVNGNALEFVFDNIDLPFEDADEEGSQGYISYKIKPKQGIVVGDIIAGDAAIYFDFNEPIITNEVSTEIIENLSVAAKEFSSKIQLYPNPTEHVMYIENNSSERIDQVGVYSITGQQILVKNKVQQINLSSLNTGIYFVKMTTESGNSFTQKVVKK